MSWFSELAGKAEAFLERVDQATATTIQNKKWISQRVKQTVTLLIRKFLIS